MRSYQFLIALILTTAFAGWAKADNLAPACTANTLSFYEQNFNSDGSCSVGILNFSGFTFNSAGSSTSLDTAGDIEVTPDGIGGFSFSQVNTLQFSVADGKTATYDIGYNFVIDAGPVGDAASLDMDPPFGTAVIDAFYCVDSGISQDGAGVAPFCTGQRGQGSPQVLHVDDTHPPTSWTTGIVALNPPALVDGAVLNRIELGNGNTGGGFDSFSNTLFTVATPEPSTVVMFLSGLGVMAIGIKGRRTSKSGRKA